MSPSASCSSSSAAIRQNDTIGFKQRLRSGRPAADRRCQFIAWQGIDAGRVLPHDERDHHGRSAAGDHVGPRAAGLDGIAPRILSRLSWGLVADVNAPDLSCEMNIIAKKLEALPDVRMPDEVVNFLARRISSNVASWKARCTASRLCDDDRARDRHPFHEEVLANVLRANQRRIRSTRSRRGSPSIIASARRR
jgi:chromosomal replication initiator protein